MRHRHWLVATGVVVAGLLLGRHSWAAAPPRSTRPAGQSNVSLAAWFAPGDDCSGPVVEELTAAAKSIRFQGRVLVSDPIGQALVQARQRGVEVWVILDDENGSDLAPAARDLLSHQIVVRVTKLHTAPYSKIILVDGSVVITGSFGFPPKPQIQNAENVLIIKGDPELARRYHQNWASQIKQSSACPSGGGPAPQILAPKPSKEAPAASDKDGEKGKDQSQQTVYVTGGGKRYHRKDCQHARTGASAISRDEATRQGKTPCRVCKPDE